MKLRWTLPGLNSQARWLRWRGLPLAVFLISLGLTLSFWHSEQRREQAVQRQAFDASLRDVSERIEQRMAAHAHLLQGAQGFLAASPQVDAQAFRRYVEALPLGADFAGVQGLAWVQAQPGPRGPAYRVMQMEPGVARNQALLQLDLAAQPALRELLQQAQESGHLALSARLNLADLGLPAQPGFVLALPVYRGVALPDTPAARREALKAWVLAPVAAGELMASLYGELPAALSLALYDGQDLLERHLLYRRADASWQRSAQAGVQAPPASDRQAREYLVLGGRTWTLQLSAGPAFAARHGADYAPNVLRMGVLLSVLLSLLAWMLGHARERAQALAEQMTRALRESEQRWAFAVEGAGDGVWDWDLPHGRLSSSVRWKQLMGLPPLPADLPMEQFWSLIHPEDLPRVRSEAQACLDGSQAQFSTEYRVAGGVGRWNWVLARGTVVERNRQQQPLRMIGTLSDINARRQSEERVRFMALHDPLTELANRAHFDERLRFALAHARRYHEPVGLILLDLDRFKPINDQFGHAVGDQLLQTVARRIKAAVRETDTVGRIGGDEFVVLLSGALSRESAQGVADKIYTQVAQPMELGGVRLEITCSLGLALFPEDGQDELILAKSADDAMYRNKRAGRPWLGDGRYAAAPPSPEPEPDGRTDPKGSKGPGGDGVTAP